MHSSLKQAFNATVIRTASPCMRVSLMWTSQEADVLNAESSSDEGSPLRVRYNASTYRRDSHPVRLPYWEVLRLMQAERGAMQTETARSPPLPIQGCPSSSFCIALSADLSHPPSAGHLHRSAQYIFLTTRARRRTTLSVAPSHDPTISSFISSPISPSSPPPPGHDTIRHHPECGPQGSA